MPMPTSSSSFTSCNPGSLSKQGAVPHTCIAECIACHSGHSASPNAQALCKFCSPALLPARGTACPSSSSCVCPASEWTGPSVSWLPCLRHIENRCLVIITREAVEIACSTPHTHVGCVWRLREHGTILVVAGEMLKKGLPDSCLIFGYCAFPFADPAVDSRLARRHRAGRWYYILQPQSLVPMLTLGKGSRP